MADGNLTIFSPCYERPVSWEAIFSTVIKVQMKLEFNLNISFNLERSKNYVFCTWFWITSSKIFTPIIGSNLTTIGLSALFPAYPGCHIECLSDRWFDEQRVFSASLFNITRTTHFGFRIWLGFVVKLEEVAWGPIGIVKIDGRLSKVLEEDRKRHPKNTIVSNRIKLLIIAAYCLPLLTFVAPRSGIGIWAMRVA